MQPIDPGDRRRPNVQIAGSIRRAILNGELVPGEQLPSGAELARFFGVTRVTIGNAIRTLRDEGFVRTKTGSGVYVRDRVSLPVTGEREDALAGVASFLFEMGHLKRVPRSGWLLLGIPQPETVAEHSFRTGIVGVALAAIDGADVGRTAALCLFHDAHETRIGDVASVGRAYVTTAAPEAISAHQTAGMPGAAAAAFQDLTAEFEAGQTLEAQIARDADKLEMLVQAVEYQAQGHDTSAWQASALAALRTESAKQLARAVSTTDPQWWSAIAASGSSLGA